MLLPLNNTAFQCFDCPCRCKDRNKLFFDTVCTLSDLNYDVYHGAIDSEGEMATQLYYIRPRFGDFFWDSVKATKLRVMLEAAIQRRFPKGLKVRFRVHGGFMEACMSADEMWLCSAGDDQMMWSSMRFGVRLVPAAQQTSECQWLGHQVVASC
jgi:hypothetical protein